MSAFDKLQSYNAKKGYSCSTDTSDNVPCEVDDIFDKVDKKLFDKTTPTGYFLRAIHNNGYKVIEKRYIDSEGNFINEIKYSSLSDEEKSKYRCEFAKTELCDTLLTTGDQLIVSSAGSGKALENSTLVETSKGSKPIGELTLDDEVIGSDLLPHKIIGIFPQEEKKQVYEITVGNDEVIKSCGEHLWTLDDGRTLTTKELYEERYLESHKFNFVSLKDFDRTCFFTKYFSDKSRALVFLRALDFDDLYDMFSSLDTAYSMGYCDGRELVEDDDIEKFFEVNFSNKEHWFGTCSDSLESTVLDSFVAKATILCKYLLEDVEISFKNNVFRLTSKYVDLDVSYLDYSIETTFHPIIFTDCMEDKSIFNSIMLDDSFDSLDGIIQRIESDEEGIYSGKFNYIKDIKLTDEYADMTCIQVDSEDKLYLLSCGVLTHNTTALIFKIMLDIANGEATKLVQVPNGSTVRVVDSVFVGTFLKSGAEELKTRLAEEQRRYGYTDTSDRVVFGTLHAEFYRALIAMNVPVKIGEAKVLSGFLHECYKTYGVHRTNGGNLTNEDFQILDSIITYCRGRLDNQRYNHPSCKDYENMTPTFIDKIIDSYKIKKEASGIYDFEDLQDMLYKYLYVTPNPAVQDFIANRYSYIYLDEFQDTSQIQYAILKFYARGRLKCNKLSLQSDDHPQGYYTGIETSGKIVAIGDDDQCIYSWRGSDVDIICNEFDKDFAPSLSMLSYNYRCPSNVLNPIIKSINMNEGRFKKNIQSAKLGGEFYAYHFTSIHNMLSQLSKDIDRDMSDGSSVAILCRTNFDGVIPAFMLEMEHKYKFSISSDLMTLSSPLPKKILSVTSLFTERTTKGVQNALELFVYRSCFWKIKELMQTLKNDNTNTNKASIWTLSEQDIEYSCPEILPIVKSIKSIIVNPDGSINKKKEIDALKFVYKYLKVNTYGGDSAYCESARAYIDALLYLLDYKEFDSVFDFQEEVNTYNDRLKARINDKKSKISIVTVHEFKGKEKDSTYVWNDSDGVFPSSKTDITDERQLEEERRVHYIACTRAKKRSTIYALRGKEGIFLNEMCIDLVDPVTISGSLKKSESINKSPSEILQEEEDNLLKALDGVSFDDEIPKL